MQVSTSPLHPFCTSSISTSMNTVTDGRHLVDYNKIHEKLQAIVSSDKQGFRYSNNQGCTVLLLNIAQLLQMAGLYLKMKENNLCTKHKKHL